MSTYVEEPRGGAGVEGFVTKWCGAKKSPVYQGSLCKKPYKEALCAKGHKNIGLFRAKKNPIFPGSLCKRALRGQVVQHFQHGRELLFAPERA